MQDGALDFQRHLNRHEAGGEVEVVFAALVDDSYVVVTGGFIIRQRPVNFVELQGRGVSGVFDADCKLRLWLVSFLYSWPPRNAFVSSPSCQCRDFVAVHLSHSASLKSRTRISIFSVRERTWSASIRPDLGERRASLPSIGPRIMMNSVSIGSPSCA